MKLTKKYIVSLLPKRPKNAHKGTFGKVLGLAGSENYPGAAYLACAAAYRVGAGLVTLVTNRDTKIIISKKLPEVTFLSFHQAFEKFADYNVILIGSGLGQSGKTRDFVKKLLREKLPQSVFDGDGLNILSKIDQWWEKLNSEVILTPHLGEMSRLTKLTVEQIQKNRENITREYAMKWKQTIVLKGANTVIASSDGKLAISPFANPLLATAGTGDVLAGVVAGLIAQGLKSFEAACVGVYIHGLSALMLTKQLGDRGLLASELLPLLPKALKSLLLFNQHIQTLDQSD